MSERAAWVALSTISGLGPARFRRLVEVFGSPLLALGAGADAIGKETGLPQSALSQVEALGSGLAEIEQQLASLEEAGFRALTWPDEDYPARLLETSSPPPVLWWKSENTMTQPEAALAIVGSREVSEEGRAEAYRIAQSLAEAGVTVVSGLAAGIDAAAHEATLDCGGTTVGVCGCGIVTAAVSGRGGLAGRVAERGAICSELAPTAPLSPKMLFARNRIIAGLVDAVIVVEARAEGGAVKTAKCARQEGRPLLVVHWQSVGAAAGNRQLLAEGAIALAPGADPLSAFAEALES